MNYRALELARTRKNKFRLSVLLIIVAVVVTFIWTSAQGPVQDGAVRQLENSDEEYVIGKGVALFNLFPLITLVTFIFLILIWLTEIKSGIVKLLQPKGKTS